MSDTDGVSSLLKAPEIIKTIGVVKDPEADLSKNSTQNVDQDQCLVENDAECKQLSLKEDAEFSDEESHHFNKNTITVTSSTKVNNSY